MASTQLNSTQLSSAQLNAAPLLLLCFVANVVDAA